MGLERSDVLFTLFKASVVLNEDKLFAPVPPRATGTTPVIFSASTLLFLLFSRHQQLSAINGLIILIYPITEILYTVLRRFLSRVPIYKPDRKHLHLLIFEFLRPIGRLKKYSNNAVTPILAFLWSFPIIVLPFIYKNISYQFLAFFVFLLMYHFIYLKISNFAKNQNYAKHNTNYWKGIPYLGIGPSAHSYIHNTRQWNVANNQGYIKTILQEQTIPSTIEELSIADQVNEYIMTSLRTMWGCDLNKINDSWYISLDKRIIEKYIQQQLINQQDQTLFLTQQGKLFADAIAADLFIAL